MLSLTLCSVVTASVFLDYLKHFGISVLWFVTSQHEGNDNKASAMSCLNVLCFFDACRANKIPLRS